MVQHTQRACYGPPAARQGRSRQLKFHRRGTRLTGLWRVQTSMLPIEHTELQRKISDISPNWLRILFAGHCYAVTAVAGTDQSLDKRLAPLACCVLPSPAVLDFPVEAHCSSNQASLGSIIPPCACAPCLAHISRWMTR
jgi:hypothetical protein